MATLALFKASDGSPLTGQATHLTWAAYRSINDGGAGAGPAFIEIGATGIYYTAQDPAFAGIVNATACTSAASDQYPFMPAGAGLVFGCWNASGVPVSGLTPTWIGGAPYDSVSLAAVAGTTLDELGDGLYIVHGIPANVVIAGNVDRGSAQFPRYFSPGAPPIATLWTVALISPASPGPILQTQAIAFTVTPGTAPATLISFLVTFPNGATEEAIVSGSTSPPLFQTPYESSGFVFGPVTTVSLVRNGGWPGSPTLTVTIVDSNNVTTQQRWTWGLQSPPSVATSTISPAQQAAGSFGSDMRTFLVQPDGTRDWDPYMLIVSDPATVLGEMILRRLSIPRAGGVSALFYDNNAGFDLHQFLNAAISSNQRQSIETAIAQEIEKDERIESCTATIDPIAAAGLMVVTINAIANTGGAFRFVIAIDAVTTRLLDYKQVAA